VMDGRPQRFAVTAGAGGVSGVTSASGTPVAVALEGNVLSFFLPYTALGFPEIGAPVFKPRVAVFRLPGGNPLSPLLDALTLLLDTLTEPLLGLDLELVDLAPGAGPLPDTLVTQKPMYGKPFTVTLDAGSAPTDRALQCVEPGVSRLSDAAGDVTADLFASDLIALNIVQPEVGSGQPALLHFVLSTSTGPSAVLPPNRAWYVSFQDKANAYHGVRAITDAVGQLSFQSYTPGPNSGGGVDGRFVVSGSEQPLEAGSEFGADGKLRLVVKADAVGLSGIGDTISGFNAGVVQNIDLLLVGLATMSDEMPDGLGRSGSLTLQPDGCGKPPVARLSLSSVRGVRPLEVRFDASYSSAEEGATIGEYRFDFGDGEPVTGNEPVVTHTYVTAGSYTASVTVTDSVGLTSEPATATITATDPLTVSLSAQCGAAACAEGTVYEVSEASPLTVSFTAAAAGGSGNGRQYTFYFGDGTQSEAQAGTTVTHDYKYANADGYHARVTVTEDQASSGATSADVVIKTKSSVNVEPTPGSTAAALEVSPSAGAVPLTVTADASGSTHATGTVNSEYAFDFGDGSQAVVGDADTATHVYTVAGTYTVTVTVTDQDGSGNTLGTPSSMSRQVSAGSGNELTALLSVSPSTVRVGQTVTFDGCHSFAADGREITAFTFDPDGDGSIAAVTQNVSGTVSCTAGHQDASVYRFSYSAPGTYVPTLTVSDDAGQSKSVVTSIRVVPATAEPPAPTGSGRRGGGGALGLGLLLPLLGLGLARRRSGAARREPADAAASGS
jgi:PKD repeat protein